MPAYEFKCLICDKRFDVIQKMNDKHIAFHCGIEAKRVYTSYQTQADLMYHFTTDAFDGTPVEVYSKKQYKALLKKHGCPDATIKECFQERKYANRRAKENNKKRTAKLTKDIINHIEEKKAMQWVRLKEDYHGPDKRRF